MRIRYKPWARKELEESTFYRQNPEALKGKWRKEFENPENPLFVELRMWKRKFYCPKSSKTPRK